MIIKEETYYYIEKSLTKVYVNFIYDQTDDWISFYGKHIDCNGIEIGYPRQMNYFKEYLNINWKEMKDD